MMVNGLVLARHYRQAGDHLSALQIQLQGMGLWTYYKPYGVQPPRLFVKDPAISPHSDVIYAAPRQTDTENEWCFWWSWGDWISRTDQLDDAVRRIAHMLRRQR
jgi:hypothetical protein